MKTRISQETVGLLIGRANRNLQQAVIELCTPHGVTAQQMWILLMLRDGEVLTGSHVSARMSIDKAAASRLIEGLVQLGWVGTNPSAADRRRQLLALTAKGKRVASRLGRQAESLNARMLKGLSPQRIEA